MSDKYTLRGHDPVKVDDVLEWAKTIESEDRIVKQENIEGPDGKDYYVSTVFLGLDHQYGSGPPLLFETMIFPPDSSSDLYCDRYSTWDEAEEGHKKAVEIVREGRIND